MIYSKFLQGGGLFQVPPHSPGDACNPKEVDMYIFIPNGSFSQALGMFIAWTSSSGHK